ncbi:hypothetical protein VIGAN_01477800, partial [Vigna angularis var. angularis]
MSYAWLAFSKIMATCQKKGFFTRKDWDLLACNAVYHMFVFVSNLFLIISHYCIKQMLVHQYVLTPVPFTMKILI